MKQPTKSLLSLILIFILCEVCTAFAQDWTQWRGPNRDGKLLNFTVPESWPESLEKRWSIDIGGGTSVPLRQGKTVYIHSRKGENEVVSALNLENGKMQWKDSYTAPYKVTPEAVDFGKGPFATPVIYDGKLFTFGIGEILSAYNSSDGKLLWRKDYAKDYKMPHAYYGTSFSPLAADGVLIVHAGGPENGALMALDINNGEPKWKWEGDGPAYASPLLAEVHGIRQIITKTQQNIIGVDFENGKLLWKVPYKVSYDNTISEPIVWNDLVLASDFQKHFRTYRLKKDGENWSTEIVWENKNASLYMSSPILRDNLLYGFSDRSKGQFFCLNPQNGEVLWSGPGRQGDHASLVAYRDYLFGLLENGELVISKVTPKGQAVIAKYTVSQSNIYNTPVFVENGVLIKDFERLTLWGWD